MLPPRLLLLLGRRRRSEGVMEWMGVDMMEDDTLVLMMISTLFLIVCYGMGGCLYYIALRA